MADAPPNAWDSVWSRLARLHNTLKSSRALHVNSASSRGLAKDVVQNYFRELRPELIDLQLDPSVLDDLFQNLLLLSNGQNRRDTYLRTIRELTRSRRDLELQREIRLGELSAATRRRPQQGAEAQIFDTLRKLLPSSAMSYRQALVDLHCEERLSFRGTAVELRETLREVLDHFAPDEVVAKSEGFKFEKGLTLPTMKQKARFILRSRGLPKTAIRAPEDSVSLVEERTASLARSVYERSSISTHVATTRQEVLRLKMYVDSVLAELLEIHR